MLQFPSRGAVNLKFNHFGVIIPVRGVIRKLGAHEIFYAILRAHECNLKFPNWVRYWYVVFFGITKQVP